MSESLAGRVAILHLFGLARPELMRRGLEAPPFLPSSEEVARRMEQRTKLSLPALYRLIWRGALPVIALNEQVDRDLFYSSYVQTYLQRDVRDAELLKSYWHNGRRPPFYYYARSWDQSRMVARIVV